MIVKFKIFLASGLTALFHGNSEGYLITNSVAFVAKQSNTHAFVCGLINSGLSVQVEFLLVLFKFVFYKGFWQIKMDKKHLSAISTL